MPVPPARRLGRKPGPIKVAIADDSGLIYSDDYRDGWVWGFKGIGCDVKVFDIGLLRRYGMTRGGPYSAGSARGYPKMMAQNITAWEPDVMFTHHGRSASHEAFLDYLKRRGVYTAVYLCDEPYEVGETARYSPRFDYVFTMDYETLEAHRLSRSGRKNVFYLPPGVNTDHFEKVNYAKRDISCFFLGNATLPPRKSYLMPVQKTVENADIRFFTTVYKTHPKWIPLEDHPKWYSRCIVGLNVHRDPRITLDCFKKRIRGRSPHMEVPNGIKLCEMQPTAWGTGFWNDANLPASHVNPRFLEMSACGTVVVSDNHRTELRRLFPQAPQAESPEHYLELVHYYLDNPDEAEAIGQSCSHSISKRHTYRHRAAEVLIRLGLKDVRDPGLCSSLGEPQDWLTIQDLDELRARSSSEATGRCERWSPQYGMSLISESGNPSGASSIDVPSPWLL